MTDIISAIKSLNANAQVVINGEPSNQAEYESQVRFISGADENGNAIFKDTQDFTWEQVSAQIPIVEFDNAMQDLRNKRNNLLTETDYIVIKAKETGATISTAWKTYRQELRDITENLTTVEEVNAVVFPTKP